MEKPKKEKSTMSLLLSGETLVQALTLKQQQEREIGKGLSLAGIVREAIAEMFVRHIETVQ